MTTKVVMFYDFNDSVFACAMFGFCILAYVFISLILDQVSFGCVRGKATIDDTCNFADALATQMRESFVDI